MINELHSNLPYPGTVVRRVPVTGNLPESQNSMLQSQCV